DELDSGAAGQVPDSITDQAEPHDLIVEIDPLVLGDGDDETLFLRVRGGLHVREADVDSALHHRSSDHENDEEHQHHVDQGRDIDVEKRWTLAAARPRRRRRREAHDYILRLPASTGPGTAADSRCCSEMAMKRRMNSSRRELRPLTRPRK